METDPNTESPQTLEKRKERGKLIYKGAISMIQLFVAKIFACDSINVLNALLHPLICMYKLCAEYPVEISCGNLKFKKKIELESLYEPLYARGIQMDCFNHLVEIRFFLQEVRKKFDEMEEDTMVIAANRIGLLISRFFQTFCLHNAAFHTIPPTYRKRTSRCSNWHY